MNAAAQLLAREFGKPSLDLIDPRRRCRREVDMIMRPAREPGSHRSSFMGAVIIHDDVNIQAGRDVGVDLLYESRNSTAL